jgi:hypothetical protein
VDALKKLVGTKYAEMFATKETISIKKEISDDNKKMNAIAAACEKAGLSISDIFDRTEKVIAKEDLDRKQYDLPQKDLVTFRTYVKQYKPALK